MQTNTISKVFKSFILNSFLFKNDFSFLAETLWSAGKFSESFDFYQKCVEKDPSDMHLYKTKARKFFFFERYQEALDEIQKALTIDSKDNYSLNLRGIFTYRKFIFKSFSSYYLNNLIK